MQETFLQTDDDIGRIAAITYGKKYWKKFKDLLEENEVEDGIPKLKKISNQFESTSSSKKNKGLEKVLQNENML